MNSTPRSFADSLLKSHGRILAQRAGAVGLPCICVYEDSYMPTTRPALRTSHQFQGLSFPAHPMSGTEDDDDDRNNERADENEAPVRAVDEDTETPEEFDVDDEDKLGHSEVDQSPALRAILHRLRRDPRSLGSR